MLGLHEPADLIIGLVPRGRAAVDVGANRGIYSYWMAKRATRVDVFEPQPALARYIRGARLHNIHVHEVALSDRDGTAEMLVPEDDGLARITATGAGRAVSSMEGSELAVKTRLQVTTRTLDSFDLRDVGFLKIDVEGHELAVLRGAQATITSSRPIVFVESEARHAPGAPANTIDFMRKRYGYRKAAFIRCWELFDIDEFDLHRDQLALLPSFMDPRYVSNFVFWP